MAQHLLAALATNEIRLAGFFLAAADSATQYSDAPGRAASLHHALDKYSLAIGRVAGLQSNQRRALQPELQAIEKRLQAVFYE